MSSKRVDSILSVLSWSLALSVFFLPFANPDVFWHLSAAQRIISTRALPQADWLSFSMQGQPWTDFEWLCELLWYGVNNFFGFWGLVVLKVALFAGTAACFWVLLGLSGRVGVRGKALAVLAWSIVSVTSNDLRPDNFSIFFFVLQWWMLESRRLGKRHFLFPWGIVPMYVLWANLHAGFAYGLALLAIYSAADALSEGDWRLAGWLLAACLSTLVNPFGWKLLQILREHSRDMAEMQAHLVEWQRPSLRNIWAAPFWAASTLGIASLLWRAIKKREAVLSHLALLVFFAASWRHARLALFASPMAVAFIAWYWPLRGGKALANNLAMGGAALSLSFFFAVKIIPILLVGRPFFPIHVPDRVVGFLISQRNVLKGHRMVNPWGWGGFLGYYLYPDMQVFVDGRYIFHPSLKKIEAARRSPEDYRELLGFYGADVVLDPLIEQRLPAEMIPGHDLSSAEPRPYYLAYLPEKDWALIYWNSQGVAFVRRSSFPERWISLFEYRFFRPFDEEAVAAGLRKRSIAWENVLKERDRFLQQSDGAEDSAVLNRWFSSVHSLARMQP